MSIIYTVDSKSLFEAKYCKPKEIVVLNRQCDNTLNNQVQVTKKVSINSVINNEKNWTEKNENPVSREIDNC